jgi:hypothetical protein
LLEQWLQDGPEAVPLPGAPPHSGHSPCNTPC